VKELAPQLPVILFDRDGYCRILNTEAEAVGWVEPLLMDELAAVFDGFGRSLSLTWDDPASGKGGPHYVLESNVSDIELLRTFIHRTLTRKGLVVDVSAMDLKQLLVTISLLEA